MAWVQVTAALPTAKVKAIQVKQFATPIALWTAEVFAVATIAAGAGLYPDLASAAEKMRGELTTFTPDMDDKVREVRLARWSEALTAA